MLSALGGSVIVASSLWLESEAGTRSGSMWEGVLAPIAVFALVVSSVAFLFLVRRLCWGIRQMVAASLQRERTQKKIVEVVREYIEAERLGAEQLWSASSALSPC